jgi:hypothetical protein
MDTEHALRRAHIERVRWHTVLWVQWVTEVNEKTTLRVDPSPMGPGQNQHSLDEAARIG